MIVYCKKKLGDKVNKVDQKEIYQILKKEIGKLKRNEQYVIANRFGLGAKKMTLAGIGRKLNLSRERVRQIEKEAIRKLSLSIEKNHVILSKNIHQLFESNGGIINKREAQSLILKSKEPTDEKTKNSIDLFIMLIPQIESIKKDEEIFDSWISAKIPRNEVAKILRDWARYLEKNKKPSAISVLILKHPDHRKHNVSFLSALPKVSRKIVKNYEGNLGLSSWSEMCPNTVRDKIHYVLKRYTRPMHFSEIARVIKNEQFDDKKVVEATVHNELIADKRYILIGRGIYALAEWGYVPGTVKSVIIEILTKSKKAMDYSDIYFCISKQRQVRKNTVLINLQTQKEFKKLPNGKYALS